MLFGEFKRNMKEIRQEAESEKAKIAHETQVFEEQLRREREAHSLSMQKAEEYNGVLRKLTEDTTNLLLGRVNSDSLTDLKEEVAKNEELSKDDELWSAISKVESYENGAASLKDLTESVTVFTQKLTKKVSEMATRC